VAAEKDALSWGDAAGLETADTVSLETCATFFRALDFQWSAIVLAGGVRRESVRVFEDVGLS
jgi:hypothetical protein